MEYIFFFYSTKMLLSPTFLGCWKGFLKFNGLKKAQNAKEEVTICLLYHDCAEFINILIILHIIL